MMDRLGSRRSLTAAALGGVLLLALASTAPATAQHEHGHTSPYAGAGSDTVKTLMPEEVAGLLAGEGMGQALPAELNGYPGPRHVLDLADSLRLTPDQVERMRAVFTAMQERAVELGRAVIEAERALDTAFAESAEVSVVRERVAAVARLRGELRWAHLEAHFRTAGILTPHQRHLYDRLRGYR